MASFIYQDDQMNELLMELVSSYVEMNIPVIDEDNRMELAMMLMETIRISARQGSGCRSGTTPLDFLLQPCYSTFVLKQFTP